MPHIIVRKPFAFAHDGHRVERFAPAAEPVETTDACAEVALAEGWAVLHAEAAPENKDAARKRRAAKAAAD